MKITKKAEPCCNFSVMKCVLVPRDPRDGREKIVLSSYAAESIGRIVIVDTETMEGETYELPNDSGAWALLWLPEREELLIGTCDHLGSLHRFQMRERRFLEPMRVDPETYLWNFTLGGDGKVYAGTYPGCALIQYDPEKQTMVSLGKVGKVEKNQYSRPVLTAPTGDIAISIGFSRNQAWLYRVHTGEFLQIGEEGDSVRGIGEDFICLANGENLRFLDAQTLSQIGELIPSGEPLDSDKITRESIRRFMEEEINPEPIPGMSKTKRGVKTASGSIMGVQGQEIFVYKDGKLTFTPIPGEAPSTAIMTIATVGDRLWGSSENGQTLFTYDPKTGEYSHTGCVANEGGEVYGLVPLNGKLFLAAYVGGDHIVYDPAEPWDQHNNVNPKTLRSVAPQMVRPHAKSVLGPDGGIWTGWYANYGSFGGGISRVDPESYEVKSWFNLIPEQAIEHLVAGKDALYVVTSGSASGMADREDSFYLAKIGLDGTVLKKHAFAKGILLRRLAVIDGRIYVLLGDKTADYCCVEVFEEGTLEPITAFPLGAASVLPTDLMAIGTDRLLVFAVSEIFLISLPDGKILDCCPSPGIVQTCTRTPDGTVWFAVRREIYQLEI